MKKYNKINIKGNKIFSNIKERHFYFNKTIFPNAGIGSLAGNLDGVLSITNKKNKKT